MAAGFFSFTRITDETAHRRVQRLAPAGPPSGADAPGGPCPRSTMGARPRRAVRSPGTEPRTQTRRSRSFLGSLPHDLPDASSGRGLGSSLLRPRPRSAREGPFLPAPPRNRAGPLPVASAYAARRVSISAAAVPFRPNRGVYVVIGASDPATAPPVDHRRARHCGPCSKFQGSPASGSSDRGTTPGAPAVSAATGERLSRGNRRRLPGRGPARDGGADRRSTGTRVGVRRPAPSGRPVRDDQSVVLGLVRG